MNKLKKYALVAALVLPTAFSFGNKADAAKAVINTDRANAVNVRSQAMEDNNIIGLINSSKEYEVKEFVDNGSHGNWLKIDFDGKDAYVGSYWFNIIEETEVISPSNFRKGDSTSTEIMKVLTKGDKVEVKAWAKNGYVKVNYKGTEGYLFANNLDMSKVSIQKPQAKAQSQTVAANNYAASNTQTYSQEETYTESYSSYDYSYAPSSSSAKEIIAQRESGGSYDARNGQYIGRYQLSSSYLNGDYSPENQERVADNYVYQRYGSWENALAFWNNNGWY